MITCVSMFELERRPWNPWKFLWSSLLHEDTLSTFDGRLRYVYLWSMVLMSLPRQGTGGQGLRLHKTVLIGAGAESELPAKPSYLHGA
jgi:hypothetical protein